MIEPSPSQLAEKLKDTAAITAAIQRAVREALLAHARAGFPVAGWQDGKVVWIPHEEILARFANGTTKT
jgi:hypothetical protein